ncbi:Cytochrome 94A1 like protein [Verticillium longisporum]|nr:Cytochrome 94A1 like protein [Verticillium longisporum]
MVLLSNPLVLGAVALSLLLWAVLGRVRLKRHGSALRNAPNTWPVVGNGLIFIQARQKLFRYFVTCERLHGYETLQIAVPSLPPGVIISDPKNLEYVFKHEGIFAKGSFVKERSWDLFGNGIINADGDLWKVQRKAGLSFLSTANLKILTQIALPRYLAQSVAHLKSQCGGAVVDLQAVFHEITTLLMGDMAYNMEMHADDEFSKAFDHASGATAERFQNPLWFIMEIFFGSTLRKNLQIVKSYGAKMVDNAVRDRESASKSFTGGSGTGIVDKSQHIEGSLIQSFLDAIGDKKMVADAALNYLSAGRDTTAQALTWTFYLLMRHPDVLAKVRQEVRRPVDDDRDLADLPYTHAVFNEALRLYPPIPFEIKQAIEHTTLPDGTFLPKGSVVVWCTWAMNRSYTTWGADADDFRPERWLEDGKVANRSAAEFPVFNGGPRTCLGKRMAEVTAVHVIAVMGSTFDFEPTGHEERVSKSSLTLPMKGGLPVRVMENQLWTP